MRAQISSARIVELRKANRYRLSVPVLFMWAPQNGSPQSGRGITRDINPSGVFVLTKSPPAVGSLVQMEVLLPKLTDSSPGMHLNGEGVVLRVEPCERGAESGFSAAIHFYPETSEMLLSNLHYAGPVL